MTLLIIIYTDHEIEKIEWSPDGSLIIVGVSAGILYVIDAESTEIVFSIVSNVVTVNIAVGAGGGGLDIFTLIYPFSSFSLPLGDSPI